MTTENPETPESREETKHVQTREEWVEERESRNPLAVDDGEAGNDPEPRREDGRQDDGNDDLTPDSENAER